MWEHNLSPGKNVSLFTPRHAENLQFKRCLKKDIDKIIGIVVVTGTLSED